MITVGIDMSKNSPGVCINDNGKISFMSFIRFDEDEVGKRMSKSRKGIIDHFSLLRKANVHITSNPRSTNLKEYSDLEVWKIEDASLLGETIVSSLPMNVDMIGMEGFSYGSKGNSGLDIAGYAYCVRKALFEKYGSSKLCIFSPANVKKVAGKGNAGKDDIMKFFLEREDQELQATPFWKGLSDGKIIKDKPVDDLVDAYYVQECTRQHLLNKLIDTK
jgi:hypothetical protein